jgi:hypothetical protein
MRLDDQRVTAIGVSCGGHMGELGNIDSSVGHDGTSFE